MKKLAICLAVVLIIGTALPLNAQAAQLLIPVGQVVGLELQENRVTVAGFDDTLGAQARQAGIRRGDELTAVDGASVHCAQDVLEALARSDGRITLDILRDGKVHRLRLEPQTTSQGPRLGIYLRQGTTGIGTVTWFDPDSGTFGALGHGVNRGGGELLEMTLGTIYPARVNHVKKGQVGEPGQLHGAFTWDDPIGSLERNTACGVFGASAHGWSGIAVPVADPSQVHVGKAMIRSTVDGGTAQEYSVDILKIYPSNRNSQRNLVLKITDPALLEVTGGIVQGMSGSPILQDGRLIGAVTHVLVNDPTMGYGIFIENMLDAAG